MEWKTVKLGDIGTIVGGATPLTKNAAYYDGDIAWITPKDLANHSHRYISRGERNITEDGFRSCSCKMMPKGSILFSSRAPIGYIAIAENDLCTNQGFKSIIPDADKIDNIFLFYLLNYHKDYIAGLGSGTTFMEVSGSVMKNIEVKIPSLKTQRRIAAILSSLDDKIENNNRINANLEVQAQALFKSWFVDFEPFGGVMPEDWKEGVLGDIAKVTSGKRPPMKETMMSSQINIPLIGAADIMGYTNAALYVTPILITGRVGTHGVVQRFNEPCWPSDNTLVVESNWYEFTYQTMVRIDYHNMNRGSTQPLITQTDLKNQKVIIPTDSIIADFEKRTGLLYRQISGNTAENQRLAALRDTLLPKLMKGEIEV